MRVAWAAAVLFSAVAGCVGGPEATEGTGGPAPSPEAPPAMGLSWPDPEDAVVRPGVRITWNGPPGEALRVSGCTANFVFASPDNATLYIGTAAHCADGLRPGDSTPVAEGATTATLAYCSFLAGGAPSCHTDPADGDPDDFALFELRPEDRALVHPATLHWGGPAGLADCTNATAGTAVVAYGNSSARTVLEPAKHLEGEVVRNHGDGTVLVRFAAPAVPADSGSPVLTRDGLAFGLVRALDPDGANHVSCMDFLLASESARGGPPVRLATAAGP
jgi:hypothetical protein